MSVILVERQLLAWIREPTEQYAYADLDQGREVADTTTAKKADKYEASRSFLAARCLQCFISSEIERVCQKLETLSQKYAESISLKCQRWENPRQ